MANVSLTTRDVARELARRYSTMTHEELDLLESILVPMKFAKNEMVLKEGEVCTNIYWVVRGLVRQYYFKNDKELTEYMATENSIVMCIETSSHLSSRSRPLSPPFLSQCQRPNSRLWQ